MRLLIAFLMLGLVLPGLAVAQQEQHGKPSRGGNGGTISGGNSANSNGQGLNAVTRKKDDRPTGGVSTPSTASPKQ